ncbi:MAG: helix-turn-helix transcriptional regulator, partial [Verrucomicrobiota bacterium]
MVTPKGIKAWLRATNRTYEEYAELIGSTKSTVSQWLREKNPNPMPRVAVRATEYLMRLEKPQDG